MITDYGITNYQLPITNYTITSAAADIKSPSAAADTKSFNMSDYGAMIILTKKDDPSFLDAEKKLLEREIDKIKSENEFADALGDNFQYIVSEGVGKDFKYLVVILSQYWNRDGDDEDDAKNFEMAKENDLNEAEKIAEMLKPTFGEKFKIEPVFENW